MNKKRIIIGGWITYLIITLAFYFIEMMYIPHGSNVRFMEMNELIPFFIGIILLLVVFFYIERHNKLEKRDIFILVIFILLFIMFTAVIIAFPEHKEFKLVSEDNVPYTWSYHTPLNDKIYYILMAFLCLLIAYICYVILPKKYYFKRIVHIFYYIMLTLMVTAMVYSFITEAHLYKNFFETFVSQGVSGYNDPKSFFINSNNFGFLYMTTICLTLLVHMNRPRFFYYIIAIILLVCSLPLTSKVDFFLSAFIIVYYMFSRFFLTLSSHKVRNIIAMSIIGGLALGIIIYSFISIGVNNEYGQFLTRIIQTTFKFDETGHSTYTGRTKLWEITIQLLNNTFWVFGIGHGLYNSIFLAKTNARVPHSGYLEIIAEGGIIYLVVFILLMLYVLYCIIKIMKKHTSLAIFEIGMLFVILIHMGFETEIPLVYSVPIVDGLIFNFLFIIPVLNARYKDTHQDVIEDIVKQGESSRYIKLRKEYYSLPNAFNFINTPIIFILLFGIPFLTKFSLPFYYYIGVLLISPLIYFFPYLINKFKYPRLSFNQYLFDSVLPYFAALVTYYLFFMLTYFIYKGSRPSFFMMLVLATTIYVTTFILIKPLHKYSDFIITICDNLNTMMLKISSSLIKEESVNEIIKETLNKKEVTIIKKKPALIINKPLVSVGEANIVMNENPIITQEENVEEIDYQQVDIIKLKLMIDHLINIEFKEAIANHHKIDNYNPTLVIFKNNTIVEQHKDDENKK